VAIDHLVRVEDGVDGTIADRVRGDDPSGLGQLLRAPGENERLEE
jgi:hypothetical protein